VGAELCHSGSHLLCVSGRECTNRTGTREAWRISGEQGQRGGARNRSANGDASNGLVSSNNDDEAARATVPPHWYSCGASGKHRNSLPRFSLSRGTRERENRFTRRRGVLKGARSFSLPSAREVFVDLGSSSGPNEGQ
jgi:hypothetical protein